MSDDPLIEIPVDLYDPVFEAIAGWSFEDEFVSKILTDDIPQRIKNENAQFWAYKDQQNNLVGFGVLTLCVDWDVFTDGKCHLYIPLLAVHPGARGRGYGRKIVEHLLALSARAFVEINEPEALHNAVFLDVYEQSSAAIHIYKKCGFVVLGDASFIDPSNGQNFYVMAKRISIEI